MLAFQSHLFWRPVGLALGFLQENSTIADTGQTLLGHPQVGVTCDADALRNDGHH